jgi:hypothetical protein
MGRSFKEHMRRHLALHFSSEIQLLSSKKLTGSKGQHSKGNHRSRDCFWD